jgi:hypothetical protein
VSQSGAPWGVVSDKVVCGVWCLERHPMGCGVWTTKKKAFIFWCSPTVAYLGWVGLDLYRYMHMPVGACMLDSGAVCGVSRCTTHAYAYLMCIVRTGTGTDLLGSAYRYRYRPVRKCVSVAR